MVQASVEISQARKCFTVNQQGRNVLNVQFQLQDNPQLGKPDTAADWALTVDWGIWGGKQKVGAGSKERLPYTFNQDIPLPRPDANSAIVEIWAKGNQSDKEVTKRLAGDAALEQCSGTPTLTQWGLIALAVLLAGSLAFMIRRRLAPRPAGA